MDPTVIIGFVLGCILLVGSIGGDGMHLFIHPPSLLIVVGGTIGATLIHFPIHQLKKIGGRFKKFIAFSKTNYDKDIQLLSELADRIKKEGRLAIAEDIDKVQDHFLRNSLQLMVDKVPIDQLETMMKDNINHIEKRHALGIKFFEELGAYAPGFGLLGTLIGLVLLMANLEDPKAIGPAMAVAMITTFYGVLFSNLIFIPLAGRLKINSYQERIEKELLMGGIMILAKGGTGFIVRETLSMLLSSKDQKKMLEDKGGD